MPCATNAVPLFKPLHMAARGNHADAVRALVAAGADLNARFNEDSPTPVMEAVIPKASAGRAFKPSSITSAACSSGRLGLSFRRCRVRRGGDSSATPVGRSTSQSGPKVTRSIFQLSAFGGYQVIEASFQ